MYTNNIITKLEALSCVNLQLYTTGFAQTDSQLQLRLKNTNDYTIDSLKEIGSSSIDLNHVFSSGYKCTDTAVLTLSVLHN